LPFDFLRRRKQPAPGAGADASTAPAQPVGSAAGTGVHPDATDRGHSPSTVTAEPHAASGEAAFIHFDGLTEDWRLTGRMNVEGRLLDALNRRESIPLSDVEWAPIDGSSPLVAAPGLRSIDPYDLIAVLAGPDTLPEYTEEQHAAHRVRKDPYEVEIEAPPFRIRGTVHLFPGTDAKVLMEAAAEMFVPLTQAVAYVDDRPVADPGIEVVLVNRLYVRGVELTGR